MIGGREFGDALKTMSQRTVSTGLDADLHNLGLDHAATIAAASHLAKEYLKCNDAPLATACAAMDGIRLGVIIGRGMVDGE